MPVKQGRQVRQVQTSDQCRFGLGVDERDNTDTEGWAEAQGGRARKSRDDEAANKN